MPVDITETSIRIRVRNPELFKEGTFVTLTISKSKGIKAVAGKLINPEEGHDPESLVIQTFIFDKEKWTAKQAEMWVKEHEKSLIEYMGFMAKGIVEIKTHEIFDGFGIEIYSRSVGSKEAPAIKILPIIKHKSYEKDGLLYIEGYANTKNNADRYGDIPIPTKERGFVYELTEFKKNPVMLLDHVNQVDHIAGSFLEVAEDEIGLKFKAVFSNSDLPLIKHARTVYAEGHGKALSIAGRWHYEDKNNPSILTLAEIYHISPVGVGADPNALTTAMQKALKVIEDKESNDINVKTSLLNAKAEIDKWIEAEKNRELSKTLFAELSKPI